MDIQEWEIRFQVCLVEGGVETIVEGSVFRWTPDEEEADKLFLSQWKRTYRKNKDWFAALVNDATGSGQSTFFKEERGQSRHYDCRDQTFKNLTVTNGR